MRRAARRVWARFKAWLLKGDPRPLRPPPAWVVRPLAAWAYLLVTVGLVVVAARYDSRAAVMGILVLDVAYGLQVYEDCRALGHSRFWWPTFVTSYGPLVAVAYAYNRRESVASRGRSQGPPPTPEEWRRSRAASAGGAGWYPDPLGHARLRYWDGSRWTHHVAA